MTERYIYLKNSDGIFKQELFRCNSQRMQIIEKWKKLYGRKFIDLTIEEEPEIKKEKQKKNKAGIYDYKYIAFAAKKSTKGFFKSLNGYND